MKIYVTLVITAVVAGFLYPTTKITSAANWVVKPNDVSWQVWKLHDWVDNDQAARRVQTETALAAIAAGANVNSLADTKSSSPLSPLIDAVLYRRTDMVQTLLDAHADPNFADETGYRALTPAATFGSIPMMQLLISHDHCFKSIGTPFQLGCKRM